MTKYLNGITDLNGPQRAFLNNGPKKEFLPGEGPMAMGPPTTGREFRLCVQRERYRGVCSLHNCHYDVAGAAADVE